MGGASRYWYRNNLTPFDGVANVIPSYDSTDVSLLIVEVGNMLFAKMTTASIDIESNISSNVPKILDWNTGLTLPVKQLPIGTKNIATNHTVDDSIDITSRIELANDGSVHVIASCLYTRSGSTVSRATVDFSIDNLPGIIVDSIAQ